MIFILTIQAAFSDEQKKDFFIIPILNYEYLGFQDQQIHSPGEGIMFTKGNYMSSLSEDRNSLMIMGMFKQFILSEARDNYSDIYHNITILTERNIKHHLFYLNFTSQAAEPFYGGLHTFVGMIGYGNELVSVYKVIANTALVITRILYPITLQNTFCL